MAVLDRRCRLHGGLNHEYKLSQGPREEHNSCKDAQAGQMEVVMSLQKAKARIE